MFHMTNAIKLKVLGATCLLAMSSVSNAAITALTDDFQSYGAAPNFAPWECYSDNGGHPGGYGCGNPSTSGPQITALDNDGSGNDFINFYANYDNANVHQGLAPNPQEAISIFRNTSYDATDTAGGATWVFDFDYRESSVPPSGSTQVGAFIRVFDQWWNLIGEDTLDTSGSGAWQSGQLSVTLDPTWTNGAFQVGFNNLVGSYEDSGMNYDNVALSASVVPIPAAVYLFGSGLGLLGWVRRRTTVLHTPGR
jgi:hypothetical protein